MKKLILSIGLLAILSFSIASAQTSNTETIQAVKGKIVDNCFSIVNREEFPNITLLLWMKSVEEPIDYSKAMADGLPLNAKTTFEEVKNWKCIGEKTPEKYENRKLIGVTDRAVAEKLINEQYDNFSENEKEDLSKKIFPALNMNSDQLYSKKVVKENSKITKINEEYVIYGIDEVGVMNSIGGVLVLHNTKENKPFVDIDVTSKYGKALSYLKAEGVTLGYPDGTFKPEQKISRLEFVVIVERGIRYKDIKIPCYTNEENGEIFTDLRAEEWRNKDIWWRVPICLAKGSGLISGYSDGTFRPNNNINFAEAAKIIATAFEKVSDDTTRIWYGKYIKGLSNISAIPTSIQAFDQFISRGEMAEIIYRIKAKRTDLPSTKYKQ